MKKILVLFSIILASQLSFAQKSNLLTYGSVKDSVYTNSYFGLSINIPHGWQIQSKELNDKLQELGKELVATDGNSEVVLDASRQRSAIILNISKYELGAAVDFNPSFLVVIENLELSPGVKNGKDYLFHTRKFMQQNSKLQYEIEPDFLPVTIGGEEFYIMNTKINSGQNTIRQQYYATINKKFAIAFVVTQNDKVTEPELDTLIQSNIKFKK